MSLNSSCLSKNYFSKPRVQFCFIFLLWMLLLPVRSLFASPIDGIVGKISQTDYTGYVEDLQDFQTRYYTTQGNLDALKYIRDTFFGFGLDVSYDLFTYNGNSYNNVVATLPGKTHPEQVYIVGAHMDSTTFSNPTASAPGADDNASGMAAVLEMARAMVGYAFDATIKFFGFNLEEQGLRGSQAYAAKAKASGEQVLGMLNFDMIAYPGNSGAKNVFLAGDSNLVDAMKGNALKYTKLTTTLSYNNFDDSDQYYFHSSLFPGSTSAFAIEAEPLNNPNYHKTTDSTDTSNYMDFAYATDITRMGVATLADFAGVIPEPSTLFCFLLGGLLLMVGSRGKKL